MIPVLGRGRQCSGAEWPVSLADLASSRLGKDFVSNLKKVIVMENDLKLLFART